MADLKLSQTTAAGALSGTELAYVVQSGNSRRTTTGAIAALAPATNLTYDQATRLLSSSTGTDVTLPLATDALDGLQSAAQRALVQALIAAGVTAAGSTVTIPHIHGDLAGALYIHVKNTTAGTLAKGSPVYPTGTVGDTTTLEVAGADSSNPNLLPAVGLLADALAPNASGHAVIAGELTGLNTAAYAIGDALYVASGGGLTATRPTTGTIQQVAIVGRVNSGTGSVTATISTELSPNWDVAYSQRLRWDGGATGLNAATGRASLELTAAATATIGTAAGNLVALDGSARLPAVDGSQLTGLPSAFNPAIPGAIGGTTPAAGTFTALVATTRLGIPSGAPASPAARDLYQVADTLCYRDSTGVERLLLNGADNLANLGNTATARNNLGLGTAATAPSSDFISATATRAANLVFAGPTSGAAAAPTFRALVAADLPAGVGGGTKTLARFTARDNQPPASNFATLNTRNSIAVLEFDAATEEYANFISVIPESANLTSGLLVRIWWMGATATSGNVRWGASFEASGTDLDADSFDSVTQVTSAANSTSGIESIPEITCTAIDSLAAGSRFRLRIARIAADATNDTMTGDAQLVAVEVRGVA